MSIQRDCPRCGFRRTVHESRADCLCKSCRDADPGWPQITPQPSRLDDLYAELDRIEAEIQAEIRGSCDQCGTEPGYQRHWRERTRACRACKKAHAKTMRGQRARKRKRVDELSENCASVTGEPKPAHEGAA